MTVANPIGVLDRLNANVLLAVTPEYGTVKKAQGTSAKRVRGPSP
jgi:hypothetical protein